ncbi:aldolase [Nocardioides sp. HDW12B]|uniref:Cgl0159 family (beta/alpha)8-fold protein n=1 Tax=Nocardioides sp. HDW12B TaxID=2714939 RepID=UPI00140E643D|nr:aldolase [Nocardioides sp. HDW12B]QIK66669.1 aldolase [Nocardioides sp. HDW12B]
MSAPTSYADRVDVGALVTTRVREPGQVARLAEARTRPTGLVGSTGRLMLVAADHPARGALGAGSDPMAMAHRGELLGRLAAALERPGVDGVLGTPDILDDLLLMGALEGKVVIGSMNRGGLAGTVFELDDRFTAYDAEQIERSGFQGGKMLVRIDPDDHASVATLEACARAVGDLADRGLMAMVEPFLSHRVDGRVRNDLSTDAVVRSAAVGAGLGRASAHTWLKLPVVDDMDPVLDSTTLPVLLLGGEVSADQEAQFARWKRTLTHPQVRGMVVGRSLLYPPDGDVAAAVDTVLEMM